MLRTWPTALIGLCLLVVSVGLALSFSQSTEALGESLVNTGLTVGSLTGVAMLIHAGTFRRTVYWRAVLLLVSAFLVGTMFKIMHWAFANLLLGSSLGLVALIYGAWFFQKRRKSLLDVLKMLAVSVACGSRLNTLLHLTPYDFSLLSTLLVWLCIGAYYQVKPPQRA